MSNNRAVVNRNPSAVKAVQTIDLFEYTKYRKLDWVIFDADNTLWDLEGLYDLARTKLCQYMRNYGFDPEDVRAFQERSDLELFDTYGRTPDRFRHPFLHTLYHFVSSPKLEQVDQVWQMANSVFGNSAKPYPGVADALQAVSQYANTAILTGGIRELQYWRLLQFPYMQFIDCWDIVDHKDVNAYSNFLKAKRIVPHHSWMVGDSLRSDIIPARSAGLNTIWVKSYNWSAIENDGIDPRGHVDFIVNSVLDAVTTILDYVDATNGLRPQVKRSGSG